jgi:hypothetical protein
MSAWDLPSSPNMTMTHEILTWFAFQGCTADDYRTILAQACLVIGYLTVGNEGRTTYLTHLCPPVDGARYQTVLDTMARLYPDVIAAVLGYIVLWCMRFWQDGWHLTRTILEVFVTDTRQQALAACERDFH